MTDEAHGDTPEEAPAPPTSTRWSEDAVAEDDAPPPPFVPGRREPPAEATPGTEPATGERSSDGGAEPTAPEPFPFDRPVDVEERETAEEHDAAVGAAAAEEAAAATDMAEDDFPFEQFDIEGRREGAGPPDAGSAATAGSDMGGGWSPTDVLEQETDDVPTPEPEPGPDRNGPAVPAHAEPSEPSAADSIEEAATLLDRMADVLRSEGEAGVRQELDSPDRLTAVLAGILAGYLSGRS